MTDLRADEGRIPLEGRVNATREKALVGSTIPATRGCPALKIVRVYVEPPDYHRCGCPAGQARWWAVVRLADGS